MIAYIFRFVKSIEKEVAFCGELYRHYRGLYHLAYVKQL